MYAEATIFKHKNSAWLRVLTMSLVYADVIAYRQTVLRGRSNILTKRQLELYQYANRQIRKCIRLDQLEIVSSPSSNDRDVAAVAEELRADGFVCHLQNYGCRWPACCRPAPMIVVNLHATYEQRLSNKAFIAAMQTELDPESEPSSSASASVSNVQCVILGTPPKPSVVVVDAPSTTTSRSKHIDIRVLLAQ